MKKILKLAEFACIAYLKEFHIKRFMCLSESKAIAVDYEHQISQSGII